MNDDNDMMDDDDMPLEDMLDFSEDLPYMLEVGDGVGRAIGDIRGGRALDYYAATGALLHLALTILTVETGHSYEAIRAFVRKVVSNTELKELARVDLGGAILSRDESDFEALGQMTQDVRDAAANGLQRGVWTVLQVAGGLIILAQRIVRDAGTLPAGVPAVIEEVANKLGSDMLTEENFALTTPAPDGIITVDDIVKDPEFAMMHSVGEVVSSAINHAFKETPLTDFVINHGLLRTAQGLFQEMGLDTPEVKELVMEIVSKTNLEDLDTEKWAIRSFGMDEGVAVSDEDMDLMQDIMDVAINAINNTFRSNPLSGLVAGAGVVLLVQGFNRDLGYPPIGVKMVIEHVANMFHSKLDVEPFALRH